MRLSPLTMSLAATMAAGSLQGTAAEPWVFKNYPRPPVPDLRPRRRESKHPSWGHPLAYREEKPGEPFQDSRGRWYVRDAKGTVRRHKEET